MKEILHLERPNLLQSLSVKSLHIECLKDLQKYDV